VVVAVAVAQAVQVVRAVAVLLLRVARTQVLAQQTRAVVVVLLWFQELLVTVAVVLVGFVQQLLLQAVAVV
jgi:hypothetical protein